MTIEKLGETSKEIMYGTYRAFETEPTSQELVEALNEGLKAMPEGCRAKDAEIIYHTPADWFTPLSIEPYRNDWTIGIKCVCKKDGLNE